MTVAEHCSSLALRHLLVTASVTAIRQVTLSDDNNCSSSPVSHFVATVAEGTFQIHMLPLEGGRRVKKSTFHLVYWLEIGHSMILSELGGTLMKRSTLHLLRLS